ncbi:glycosyl hydrolase family 95 catalytic domain-containing protein [Flavobacterium gilvum]|uniref:Glycosyl hydrolase family 95 catalytic domain-containing protein n=1 Tax=Flavobacterium gilvum TaxID=1492737 RepID=A0AAC9N6F4_9FLAO|nr:hypothetical protein [Flavobacterium gilvum]AOW10317.1 hypothetical protein EM308_12830 [Flavobacterium gilvum]KFC59795.1 hypothetical protein FEM08_14630 [Flavobacterium gilvum]
MKRFAICIKKGLCFVFLSGITLMNSALFAQSKSAKEIVGKYQNVFTKPPSRIPSNVSVDAPLLGNGFTTVAIAGTPELQNYYLARNDFWRLKSGYDNAFPTVLGNLKINIPKLEGAAYKVTQNLYNATTITQLSKDDLFVEIQSIVAEKNDCMIIDIINKGKSNIEGKVLLEVCKTKTHQFPDTLAEGSRDGLQWIQRGFVKDVDIKTIAVAAVKILGNPTGTFTVLPGQKVTLVCAFSSNFKSNDGLKTVQQEVKKISEKVISKIRQEHEAWWDHFWNESYVTIGDSIIESQYYKSQYNIASCSRDPKFPPGIFGWVTKDIPAWNGDYHLNYNYSAPFYALYSSNHLLQAKPYEAPLLDFIPRGKVYSEKLTSIPNGILYPVGIGPLGIETVRTKPDDALFLGQKSNTAYCATNLAAMFYRTYDKEYAKRVYPFVKATAIFWQHYLKKDGNRYIIENDAIHEGTYGTVNPILSLGLVPMVLKTAIDMSVLLGVDGDLRSDWKDKADHISKYTTQVRNGKTVFRYSEKGTDWWNDNTLGIQQIYPAGQIGLDSDPKLLEIAHNTIDEMHRWKDFNGSNSFFPAAVRIGYDSETILKNLREYSLHTYSNGFQLNNPHGIENCSTVPNTINEMLCMSNQNVLRVFPVWPKEKEALFANIRSEGAFLVSSELKNKVVVYIKIHSDKGRECVLQNPWPGQELLIKSNKKADVTKKGDRVTIPTVEGEELVITPLN